MCCYFEKHGWLYCWFILTPVIAFLNLITVIATSASFPGAINPASQIVLALSTIIIMIVCIVVIVMFIKQWHYLAVYIVILFCLIFTTCCSLADIVSLFPPGGISLEKFIRFHTVDYSKTHNGEAPELLNLIQNTVPCCGASDFKDYIQQTPTKENDTFTIPDTCCIKFGNFTPENDCGHKLNLTTYNNLIIFLEKLKPFLKPALLKEDTLDKVLMNLEGKFRAELGKFASFVLDKSLLTTDANSTNELRTPVVVVSNNQEKVPSFINQFVQEFIDETMLTNNTNNLTQVEFNLRNGAVTKFQSLQNVRMVDIVPVNVFGCATFIGMAKDIKMLNKDKNGNLLLQIEAGFDAGININRIFVIIYAILNLICLGLFNYCYWKIIRPQANKKTQVSQVDGANANAETYSSPVSAP